MKVNITSRKFEPSDKLKEYIHSRLKRIEKICKGVNSCTIILQKESRAEKVELIVKDKNDTYISKCFSSRFEKTIAKAVDNILVQIKKRTKRYHRVSSKSDINDYLDK